MKIKCKHCGEYFYPDDDTMDLIFAGYISSNSVNTCNDCWEMIENPAYDISEMHSDADPGL